MSQLRDREREQRVLLLLPTARDRVLTRELLDRQGVLTDVCRTASGLEREIGRGCGAVILAEEMVAPGGALQVLARAVEAQPHWSDLPILLLTGGGADSPVVGDAVALLSNVTLLERPLRVAALLSAVHTALRARNRQYEIRSHLAKLEKAHETEVLAARRKDEFLAMLAHELRNPLAPISNALHVLSVDDADPVQREALREMMRRQVDHMVRLVDDLLEASRLSRGMIALHTEILDLRSSLTAALDQSRPQLERSGCRVDLDLPDHPLPIEADPVRIAQVFGNLLNNAGKYGRRDGRVEVRAWVEGESVVVEVADDGQGIEPELLPRVFDLFTQGPRAGDGLREGLGIGLALVRRLVELHGGEVLAHSDGPGRGARFTVKLALAKGGEQHGSPPRSTAMPKITRGGDLRVLVVDDNADAAVSLAMVLESTGLEPRVARSGTQALGMAREYRPHVVLLDIGMPQMDGYEVARRLRADPHAEPRPLLVAVTGWSHPRDHERCRAAGFDHHFSKPADVPAILELIDSLRNPRGTPVMAGAGT